MLNNTRQKSFCKPIEGNRMDVGKTDKQGLDVAIERELVLQQGPCQ